MVLARYDDTPFGEEHVVAAVVARMDAGNLHAGLFYWDGQKVSNLHLGWEDSMSDTWEWAGVWAAPQGEPEQLNAAAGMCRLVWSHFTRSGRFPYGIHFEGASFSPSGRLQLDPKCRGLTCASFIVAVLQAARVPLVDVGTWPVRPKADRRFIESLRSQPWAQKQLPALEQEVDEGAKRIWPDEVVAACSLDPLPADFKRARSAADRVLQLLKSEP